MSHLANNPALIKRVRRIAGQVAAIERALTNGEDCATTLHLVAAVRGAMNGLNEQILTEHLQSHVAAPGLTDEERAQGADELITAISRYSK